MDNYEKLMETITNQEEILQFDCFNNEDALRLGLIIVDNAKKHNKKITIDITRNSHQLFHYSFDGTSPDNDQWVIRKSRVVNRFNRSSLYVGTRLKHLGMAIESKYSISSMEYAPVGGGFPLKIKGIGVVGAITVSGLTQEEDHNMVVEGIRDYLKQSKENKICQTTDIE